MGKIILIASGKGGTGKTTAAANIAAAIAASDKLTLAVDMDMGLRNLDIALGLESSVVYDICDVIEEHCTLDDALIRDNERENLYMLSAPQTRGAAEFDPNAFSSLWKRLRERFDYCIIDAPAGIGGGFLYALEGADAAAVITTADAGALRDADRVISVIEDSGIEDIRLILNRIRPELIHKGVMMNADDCVDMLRIPVLGIVPEDDEIRTAAFNGRLASEYGPSRAGTAFSNIAGRILGREIPIMAFEQRTGFLGRLRHIFKG